VHALPAFLPSSFFFILKIKGTLVQLLASFEIMKKDRLVELAYALIKINASQNEIVVKRRKLSKNDFVTCTTFF